MTFFIKITMIALALMAAMAMGHPTLRSATCNTYGTTPLPGFTDSMMSQWCGMVETNVNGLVSMEDPRVVLPQVEALYKQANIGAPPSSALPNVTEIMQDPMARAAVQKTLDNYPVSGSMDNSEADIQQVYADAIRAACKRTGIPSDLLVSMIWTESKGFPLVYGSLGQMDYVAWGQMVDQNSELKNRYLPMDNIVASAMFLAEKHQQSGLSWEDAYTQLYQDPNAASYATASQAPREA